MKLIRLIVLVLVLISISPLFTLAHVNNDCKSGSESSGWKVFCGDDPKFGHQSKTSINYKFNDWALYYIDLTKNAEAHWNNTGIVSISENVISKNTVATYYSSNGDTVAYVSFAEVSDGHLLRWDMRNNTYFMGDRTLSQNQGTARHEFGHTIGLDDLKFSSNIDKLMYGFSSRTTTTTTASDRTGARETVRQ